MGGISASRAAIEPAARPLGVSFQAMRMAYLALVLLSACPDREPEVDSTGRWVAVGREGTVLTSDDSLLWVRHQAGERDLASVAHGGGRFVAVGAEGTIVRSDDGLSWSEADSPTAAPLTDVIHDGQRF